MPITVKQDETRSDIVWQVFEGSWTLEDYVESIRIINDEIKSCEHTVHVIGDMRGSASPPAKMLSISGFVERSTPENRGIVVIVGSGAFVKVLLRVVKNTMPRLSEAVHYADSVEDAYALIDAENPSQP